MSVTNLMPRGSNSHFIKPEEFYKALKLQKTISILNLNITWTVLHSNSYKVVKK